MNLFSVMIFTTKKAIDECPSQYMNVSQPALLMAVIHEEEEKFIGKSTKGSKVK